MLVPLNALTQETETKQLQFLLSDLRNNFKKSIGAATLTRNGDSTHLSKVTLQGSVDSQIDIAKDGRHWAAYTAYVSDSCSLKEAKRLAKYWRTISRQAAPNYNETKKNGKEKTFSGHPFFGYDFELIDDNYKNWIAISYAERPLNNGYSVMLSLGRQIQ